MQAVLTDFDVEPNLPTPEFSGLRPYRGLATTEGQLADPTTAHASEVPFLPNTAQELAGGSGAGAPVPAQAHRLRPAQARDLLGEDDERTVWQLGDGQS